MCPLISSTISLCSLIGHTRSCGVDRYRRVPQDLRCQSTRHCSGDEERLAFAASITRSVPRPIPHAHHKINCWRKMLAFICRGVSGRIVNVASVAGTFGLPGQVAFDPDSVVSGYPSVELPISKITHARSSKPSLTHLCIYLHVHRNMA